MNDERKNAAAVALGRLGGKASSPAKRRAARENGKLGGRPSKAVDSAEAGNKGRCARTATPKPKTKPGNRVHGMARSSKDI
jgi:hypothetical protein